jgi:alpha-ribazole phosphatase
VNETTRIDLLRHGECEGGHIFRGHNDVCLSARGLEQMRRSIAAAGPWSRIISSPLQRCRVFADELTNAPLQFDERLQEVGFGIWEGRPVEEVWRTDTEVITAWSRDPTSVTPTQGEPLVDVAERVDACFRQLTLEHRGQRLLLVTHGGVIRVLLSQLMGMPLSCAGRIHVPYAALSTVVIHHNESGDQIQLLGHNWRGAETDPV